MTRQVWTGTTDEDAEIRFDYTGVMIVVLRVQGRTVVFYDPFEKSVPYYDRFDKGARVAFVGEERYDRRFKTSTIYADLLRFEDAFGSIVEINDKRPEMNYE